MHPYHPTVSPDVITLVLTSLPSPGIPLYRILYATHLPQIPLVTALLVQCFVQFTVYNSPDAVTLALSSLPSPGTPLYRILYATHLPQTLSVFVVLVLPPGTDTC